MHACILFICMYACVTVEDFSLFLYLFIEERRCRIRAPLMLIYPLRIYTSCIPHGVDNIIIHIRGCGKTDLLLLRFTYMEILPASHPTVYIYADS